MPLALPRPPEAVVLDMDGLLVDSEPLWHRVEHAVARAHGGRWTAEHSLECVGHGLRKTAEVMRELLALELDESAVVEELVQAFLERLAELRLKPGATELLGAVSGKLPVALASSSTATIIDAVLERFALRARFEVVVSGSDVVHPKPAPDIFLLAADRLGVAPARCVVLEDSPAGVTAARAAGMMVIAVPEREPTWFATRAHVVVDDLHQASRLLP